MKYALILLVFSLVKASGHGKVVFHRGDIEYIQEGDNFKPVLYKDKIAKKKFKSLLYKPDYEKGAQNVTTDQKSNSSTTKQPENSHQPNDADGRTEEVKKKRKSSSNKSRKKKDRSRRSVSEKEGQTSESKSRKKSKKRKSKGRR
ncbi:hypothetical protein NBO_10g0105 [Nosema bombycis CQ1]|uniref:Uncharacterized protein n=1 Tax=Nosema bombycis (strain CQ1 / CVCC 102059) TaxID=578461 RepID=R0MLJ0_NOSB1|nr:hypothetical protein NBO_10g0105 [Nosema bombycis CQ1]|eukprot:EOB15115.1 hypothetical protein NBO_10g0105 [Nosema bombycis CQ1]